MADHPYYVEKYNTEFESLWKQFASNQVQGESSEKEHEAASTIQSAYRQKKGYQGGGGKKWN